MYKNVFTSNRKQPLMRYKIRASIQRATETLFSFVFFHLQVLLVDTFEQSSFVTCHKFRHHLNNVAYGDGMSVCLICCLHSGGKWNLDSLHYLHKIPRPTRALELKSVLRSEQQTRGGSRNKRVDWRICELV